MAGLNVWNKSVHIRCMAVNDNIRMSYKKW